MRIYLVCTLPARNQWKWVAIKRHSIRSSCAKYLRCHRHLFTTRNRCPTPYWMQVFVVCLRTRRYFTILFSSILFHAQLVMMGILFRTVACCRCSVVTKWIITGGRPRFLTDYCEKWRNKSAFLGAWQRWDCVEQSLSNTMTIRKAEWYL